jgi:transcriptional regulator with XRE-family HTH domain
MAQGSSSISEIGSRLKTIRREAGLTLTETSGRTGVAVSTLSKIENGQISPSFDIIQRIADGLDMSLEDLVQSGRKSRVSGRKTVTRSGEGARFTSGQYDYIAHGVELSRKAMAPLEMTVRARTPEAFDHWSAHPGEEFVYVLSGEIEVHTDQYAPFRLAIGESAYFDSGMRHLFVSTSPDDARILSVAFDMNWGASQVTRFMHPTARAVGQAPED